MNELQFLQTLIGAMFGVSLFVKMWRHSISTFLMLFAGTFSLFTYEFNKCVAVFVFSVCMIYLTLRATRKPKGDTIWT